MTQPATVVVSTGHPSKSLPSDGVNLSGQHPNSDSAQSDFGHPRFLGPFAGETPSGQHPCLVSLHVSGVGQPSSNGPVALVFSSGQHPNLDFAHSGVFGLGLHLRGFCSLVMIEVSVYGVLLSSSSSPSRTQMSNVLPCKSVLESEDKSLTSVELSVDASLDSDASLTEDTVDTASVLDGSCVETVSSVTVDSVGPVD